MGKSQESFNKKEKEKKRLKKRQDKQKRKEERKANSTKGGEIVFQYVNEFGQLTDTPPDPESRVEIDAEDIVLGIPKKEASDQDDSGYKGRVEFFDDSKGYGFIKDAATQEKYFVHISGVLDEIKEGDTVAFELEKGMKGMNAVRVKKV